LTGAGSPGRRLPALALLGLPQHVWACCGADMEALATHLSSSKVGFWLLPCPSWRPMKCIRAVLLSHMCQTKPFGATHRCWRATGATSTPFGG
jgi:hypothetical protein